MLISRSLEYALRLAAVLALMPEGSSLRADELAEKASVPRAYVSKILTRLSRAKILTGIKGHGGGFALSRDPAEISMREIFAAIEGATHEGRCVFAFRRCNEQEPCVLHHRWQALQSLFSNWADSTTLAHLRRDVERGRAMSPFDGVFEPRREKRR